MPRQISVAILSTIFLLTLLLPVSVFAEQVSNMDDLYQKLAKSGLKLDVAKKEIVNAQKVIDMRHQRARQKTIDYKNPRDIFPISPKYIAVSFDAKVGLRGASVALRKKDAVVAILFKRNQANAISLVSYLLWAGRKDLKDYKSLTLDKLCRYYREAKNVSDCFPTKEATAKAPSKSGKYFTISGADITSGIVKEEFIDDIITRDYELQEAKEDFYTKEHVDKMAARIEKLENILVGKQQEDKSKADSIIDKLSNLDSKMAITGSLSERVKTMEQNITKLEKSLDRLATIFEGVTRKGNTIVISKANVAIVNGSGQSEGKNNGLGNLVIGYNDNPKKKVKLPTLSHYLIVGGNDVIQGRNPHFGK